MTKAKFLKWIKRVLTSSWFLRLLKKITRWIDGRVSEYCRALIIVMAHGFKNPPDLRCRKKSPKSLTASADLLNYTCWYILVTYKQSKVGFEKLNTNWWQRLSLWCHFSTVDFSEFAWFFVSRKERIMRIEFCSSRVTNQFNVCNNNKGKLYETIDCNRHRACNALPRKFNL